ncbi:hypothetical protein FGB62_25g719 [Gracilaria domingensis]|nr:hypothetical protein FGB62_25g719 [Gracilaria domingensis]
MSIRTARAGSSCRSHRTATPSRLSYVPSAWPPGRHRGYAQVLPGVVDDVQRVNLAERHHVSRVPDVSHSENALANTEVADLADLHQLARVSIGQECSHLAAAQIAVAPPGGAVRRRDEERIVHLVHCKLIDDTPRYCTAGDVGSSGVRESEVMDRCLVVGAPSRRAVGHILETDFVRGYKHRLLRGKHSIGVRHDGCRAGRFQEAGDGQRNDREEVEARKHVLRVVNVTACGVHTVLLSAIALQAVRRQPVARTRQRAEAQDKADDPFDLTRLDVASFEEECRHESWYTTIDMDLINDCGLLAIRRVHVVPLMHRTPVRIDIAERKQEVTLNEHFPRGRGKLQLADAAAALSSLQHLHDGERTAAHGEHTAAICLDDVRFVDPFDLDVSCRKVNALDQTVWFGVIEAGVAISISKIAAGDTLRLGKWAVKGKAGGASGCSRVIQGSVGGTSLGICIIRIEPVRTDQIDGTVDVVIVEFRAVAKLAYEACIGAVCKEGEEKSKGD